MSTLHSALYEGRVVHRRHLPRAHAFSYPIAQLYLDLDDFKVANDRGGHEAGDRLLREVGQRLLRGLRQGDLVARVGGDEFVAILPGCPDPATAAGVAETLRNSLRRPHALAGEEFRLDASVGIACFPADGNTPEELLRHADLAMYAAKRADGAR